MVSTYYVSELSMWSKMSVEEINQLNPDFVSFSRGKKVAQEMMEPQGLEGKRCVLFDGHVDYTFLSWHAGSVRCYITLTECSKFYV